MRPPLALACLAACGRLGFETQGVPGDVVADGSDAATTGQPGARWLKQLGDPATRIHLTGIAGRVWAVQRFSSTFGGDDVSVAGQGFISSGMVEYTTTGAVVKTTVFDSDGFCDLRVALADDTGVTLAGYTSGTNPVPAFGACSLSTNRQDPIVLRVAANGTESILAHWTASAQNAQIWFGARYADGQLALAGIYSGGLNMGSPLPTAMADPNAWVARPLDGMPTNTRWVFPLNAPTEVHAGPVAARGTSACVSGAFLGSPEIMGTIVTSVGGYDAWIARVDEDASIGYVRSVGSPSGNEADFGDSVSVAALPDGACALALFSSGDITFASQTFPSSGGTGLLLRLDASGNLVSGVRLPRQPKLAVIGDRLYGALELSAPATIGGMSYTPEGSDALIVELDGTGAIRIIGVLGGAGDQRITTLEPVADDALAFGATSIGALAFGTITRDSGAATIRVVGVLGI